METTEILNNNESNVSNFKSNINRFKTDIKLLAEQQKSLRNQRKAVHLVGERTMNPNEASNLHLSNGNKLRIMYAAYGLMRGKSFSQTESHYAGAEKHPLEDYRFEIDKLIQKYSVETTE